MYSLRIHMCDIQIHVSVGVRLALVHVRKFIFEVRLLAN